MLSEAKHDMSQTGFADLDCQISSSAVGTINRLGRRADESAVGTINRPLQKP